MREVVSAVRAAATADGGQDERGDALVLLGDVRSEREFLGCGHDYAYAMPSGRIPHSAWAHWGPNGPRPPSAPWAKWVEPCEGFRRERSFTYWDRFGDGLVSSDLV